MAHPPEACSGPRCPRRRVSQPAFLARLGLAVALLVGVWLPASAQSERPWTRLFGSKPAEKPARPAPAPDPRRLTEVQVEIAWLADPVTFPYYLEARVGPASMEVRGYVPNRAVHDHALNVARVYSSLPVVDALKEHGSLLVRPGHMSPPQLQNSVVSALREALPKTYQQLKVQCGPDGRVTVTGSVGSLEERLAVSHALRRLHGCTSVHNLAQAPSDVVANPGKGPVVPRETTPPPVVTTSNTKPMPPTNTEPPLRPTFGPPLMPPEPSPDPAPAPPEKAGPELPIPTVTGPFQTPPKDDGPSVEPKAPTVGKEPTEPVPPATPELVARLKKRIEEGCPGLKSVKIEIVSPSELRIEATATKEDQVTPFASAIFAIPDVQTYRADVQFRVEAP